MDGDLIADMTFGFGADFESGFVDPANGVEAFNFNFTNCLEMWYDSPITCFWHGLGPACHPLLQMHNLTDGSLGQFAVVLRDFARSNFVGRYDLGAPHDLEEIRAFTRMAGLDNRVFQHYDVYVSHNYGESFVPLASGGRNGEFGDQNVQWAVSYTRVYHPSGIIAEGVTNVRFVWYCVGMPGNTFVDPWQGYANEVGDFVNCAAAYPAEPRDVDGLRKAFVASFLDELDVLGFLPGDGNRDGVVHADDWLVLAGCIGGPGSGPLRSTCLPLDFSPRNGAVDMVDVAVFQRLLQ